MIKLFNSQLRVSYNAFNFFTARKTKDLQFAATRKLQQPKGAYAAIPDSLFNSQLRVSYNSNEAELQKEADSSIRSYA